MGFILDIEKTIEAALYVACKINGCDMHKLSKVLYFADQKHLAKYGRPITGETYIAMKNGPVPSYIYDVMKYIRGGREYMHMDNNLKDVFGVVGFYIDAKRQPDLDYLSSTDIELLDISIFENKDLDFFQLTEKSHDNAWKTAPANLDMRVFDIAAGGGADTAMLKYIGENIFHQQHAFIS